MAADCCNSPNRGSTPVNINYSDDDMTNIQANAANSVYIQLFGKRIGCFKLGSNIHDHLNLKGYVKVNDEGRCRYSAKFSSQRDYEIATQTSYWSCFNDYSIKIYRWRPNFQFSKAPLLAAGDMVEARLEGLPLEYRMEGAGFPIANAVCQPLGCHVSGVDTSRSKSPRFWFKLIGVSSDYDLLPLHVQLPGGPLVGLAYSPAKQCYNCRKFGHISWTCPEPRQRSRSPNRASSGPAQGHHRPRVDPEPVPITGDEIGAGVSPPSPELHEATSPVSVDCFPTSSGGSGPSTPISNTEMRDIPVENGGEESRQTPHGIGALQTLESESQGSGASLLEEITPAEPFSVAECYAICSDRSSKPTPLPKTEMRAPVASIIENGKESRSTWYDLGEKVSKVDVAVRVTHLNDQRGTRRQVNITSHTGNTPVASCSKGLLYTSIEDAGDRTAIRKLRDTCNQNGVSMAVVLDKSSVLANDDRIVRCFGFSASHCAEMIFRSFREDGSPVDVKGSCLLMWKREELCVDVWDVWCGNTELLSQYLAFSVSWVVG